MKAVFLISVTRDWGVAFFSEVLCKLCCPEKKTKTENEVVRYFTFTKDTRREKCSEKCFAE